MSNPYGGGYDQGHQLGDLGGGGGNVSWLYKRYSAEPKR